MSHIVFSHCTTFANFYVQNGLDNSGDTGHYRWVGNKTHNGAALYEHWTMRGADWVGSFNTVTNSYTTIDITHMLDTLRVISIIVDKFKDHPVVMGVEPGERSAAGALFL